MANRNLKDALNEIRGDAQKTKAFVANPVAILEFLGVDTSKVIIGAPEEGKPAPEAVCGSVGCVGCISAGD
jgi:hypothetical protein